jgi:dihydropyrimidinase
MAEFDTVIRNAVVVTAADVFPSDIGIAGGVVTALGRDLGPARREIDAAGRYVLPGGIDAHCHFDQPMRDSVTLADDFLSGPISAAHGGTTTVGALRVPAPGTERARRRRGLPSPRGGEARHRLRVSPDHFRSPPRTCCAASCPR